jgi:hypothetical protein
MKVIEVVNMLSNATFHALLPDVLDTVSTTALSLAVGEKVSAIVFADFQWNASAQRL